MTEFALAPMSSKYGLLFFLVFTTIIPVIIIAASCLTYFSIMSSKVVLSEQSLDIESLFYGREISLDEIKIDQVKSIKRINSDGIRTNGISVMDLNWGWFSVSGKSALDLFHKSKIKQLAIVETDD